MTIDHDLHVHTALSACCQDPTATPASLLAAAAAAGLKTVGFADHMWDRTMPGASAWYAPQDQAHVGRIREQLPADTHGVRVLCGCESEFGGAGKVGISRGVASQLDFVLMPMSHLHMKGYVEPLGLTSLEQVAALMVARFRELLALGLATGIAHPITTSYETTDAVSSRRDPAGRRPHGCCAGKLRAARQSPRAQAQSAVESAMHQSGRQHLLATSACQAPALSPKWEAAPAGDLCALRFRQNRLIPARFKPSGAVPLWSDAERHGKLVLAGLHSGVGRGRSPGSPELPVYPHSARLRLRSRPRLRLSEPGTGTAKGVTDFLRQYVGTRFLYQDLAPWVPVASAGSVDLLASPAFEFLPTPRIAVPADLDVRKTPPIDFSVGYPYSGSFCDIANNRFPMVDTMFGGHTYERAVPLEKYYDTHPEYFALVGGQRLKAGQYCISNPQVQELLYQDMIHWLDEGYATTDLGQPDGFQACQCDKVRTRLALVRREFDYLRDLARVVHLYHAYQLQPDLASRDRLLDAIDARNAAIAAYYVPRPGARSASDWAFMPFPFPGHDANHLRLAYDRYQEPVANTCLNWDTKAMRQAPLPGTGPAAAAPPTKSPLRETREKLYRETFEVPADWKTLPNPLPEPLTTWLFHTDPLEQGVKDGWFKSELNDSDWVPAPVPAFWAEVQGVGEYQGIAWYRARFRVPAAWQGKTLRLCFGAADEQAWVYVNGQLIREHTEKSEGKPVGALWETPFTADVPPGKLKLGEINVLAVRVRNDLANGGLWRPVLAHAVDPGK